MPKLRNLLGQRFGRLSVLARDGANAKGKAMWRVRCDCGAEKTVVGQVLYQGDTRSCGCLNSEQKRQICVDQNTTHGDAPRGKRCFEYRCWVNMIQRCENPDSTGWSHYGGRGIRVCARWKTYENFLADMDRRPSSKHTLDRIDPNGDYEPSNCRWLTMKEQENNRTNNRLLTFQGRTQTLMQWAEETGLKRETISKRLDRLGWSVEDALSTSTSPLPLESRR